MSYYLLPGAEAAAKPPSPRTYLHTYANQSAQSAPYTRSCRCLAKVRTAPVFHSLLRCSADWVPMFDALRNDPRFQKRCEEKPEVTSREFFGKVKRRNGTVFGWLCFCCRVSDTDPQNWLIKGAFCPLAVAMP